jgi:hypothetical protein
MRVYRNTETGAYEPPGEGVSGAAAMSFPITGHTYYGASTDLRRWFHKQLAALLKGRHTCRILQRMFTTGATMEFGYVPTATLAQAQVIARKHRQVLRGTKLLLNQRLPQLHSARARAKTKERFQTEAYQVKVGEIRKALWGAPAYRERVLASRATEEAKAKRAAHWRRVSINGEIYSGLAVAAKATQLSRMTIHRRCDSDLYPHYFYLPPLIDE